MKAELVDHTKVIDESGNTIELILWKLPEPTKDRPHGYKYSLVYISDGERVIGYDNSEGKGDHIHIRGKERSYKFTDVRKLIQDFYNEIERFRRGEL
jgi:hypothetical protein